MLSLADAIIEERIDQVMNQLYAQAELNQVDEYGFTPLIEATIADNFDIAKFFFNNSSGHVFINNNDFFEYGIILKTAFEKSSKNFQFNASSRIFLSFIVSLI